MANQIKVLVVDDEDEFRNNMVRLLRMQDMEVEGAASGEEAVALASETDYDVILLDVKMPGLTAMGTMQRLKDLGCPAEVVILTGHASVDDAVQLMNLGAYDYMLKPCSTRDIVKKIAWAVENRVAS